MSESPCCVAGMRVVVLGEETLMKSPRVVPLPPMRPAIDGPGIGLGEDDGRNPLTLLACTIRKTPKNFRSGTCIVPLYVGYRCSDDTEEERIGQ